MESIQAFKHSDEDRRLEALVTGLDPTGKPQIRWVYRAPKHIEESGGKLGIFSGSFNPLTVAHVRMIEAAQAGYGLDGVLLILAKANVDKGVFGLSLADRLLMLKQFAMNRENFSVAVCSHGRFIEKIEALQAEYPPGTQFSFIVGYDTLVRIFDPKYYTDLRSALDALFDRCRLIVANREEHDAEAVKQLLAQPDHRRYASCMDLIELPDFYAEISSTDIRARLQGGDSIDHLVPSEVQEFLKAAHAYQA
ncbi:MAG: nicotinate-nicotinamide nucleotide adenylyltransferase [Candidatus Poribacteria bacterium]|nr:nicotinate-nicotinamide nucleotide adenylyltransferase [Candidatus Poribacteria bacterium]